MLRRIFHWYSGGARERRGEIFLREMRPRPEDRILDLGGGDGAYLAHILQNRTRVHLADIDPEAVDRGVRRFGLCAGTVLSDTGPLPFGDEEFDIVFCNSVIEHVTGAKEDLSGKDSRTFARDALDAQREFAEEIARVGRRYFVQTPNRNFPIESHTWLPVVSYLPRPAQHAVASAVSPFWPKQTRMDWRLFTRRELASVFPDARILPERSLGLVKSWIAVRG